MISTSGNPSSSDRLYPEVFLSLGPKTRPSGTGGGTGDVIFQHRQCGVSRAPMFMGCKVLFVDFHQLIYSFLRPLCMFNCSFSHLSSMKSTVLSPPPLSHLHFWANFMQSALAGLKQIYSVALHSRGILV